MGVIIVTNAQLKSKKWNSLKEKIPYTCLSIRFDSQCLFSAGILRRSSLSYVYSSISKEDREISPIRNTQRFFCQIASRKAECGHGPLALSCRWWLRGALFQSSVPSKRTNHRVSHRRLPLLAVNSPYAICFHASSSSSFPLESTGVYRARHQRHLI